MAAMGDYLVGILTAPVTLDPDKPDWPDDLPLTLENGFVRIHPPRGHIRANAACRAACIRWDKR